jgi:hypothetical protein
MPYSLIPLLAAVILGMRFVFLDEPSRIAKALVGIAVVASLVVWWNYPALNLAATLVQVAVAIFVIVYLKANQYAA